MHLTSTHVQVLYMEMQISVILEVQKAIYLQEPQFWRLRYIKHHLPACLNFDVFSFLGKLT